MVDIAGRNTSQGKAELVNDLRAKLRSTTDAAVRRALEQALAALETAPATGEGIASAKRMAAALASKGLTSDPGELAFTQNALTVLKARYLQKNTAGEVIETPEGMLRRVARAIAEGDLLFNPKADVQASEEEFYHLMARLDFLPNSPTMMNAGTGAGTLSACFVLPLKDSMEDIMGTAHDIAMVQKFGGGTGVALSDLRHKGAPISTTHGRACGPIAVLKHLSSVSTMITQGGKRDGANMAVMNVHHPDLLEFINCKHEEGVIHNYNISVGVDEEFMQAVRDGGKLELRDPRDGKVVEVMDARNVFQKIVDGAWRNGEPGMIFLDRVNLDNPTPHLGLMSATNPCGEQPLLPYESCNLGSINMSKMASYDAGSAEIDWERLRKTVWTAVHFLDNIIDINNYSVPEIEKMTKLTRKIGLGVMGFSDMLIRMGVPYDSEDGVAIGREVMRFIRQEADAASVELAKDRGVFPAFKGSRHDRPGGLRLRNACRLTVAPTGTISMIAGCSSGVEPVFALAFRKQNILGGATLYYTDSAFEAVAKSEEFWSEELLEDLSQGHSLKNRMDVPQWVKEVFTTAPDIAPEYHVKMQAAFQESTDAAISKTINFPNEASVDDVRTTYMMAWELGCKGITVYRAGSREKEVLTAGTKAEMPAKLAETSAEYNAQVPMTEDGLRKPRVRPQSLQGLVERVRTGQGNMYVTVTFDEVGQPFEAFASLGKAGGNDAANLEAIARLVSMALRSGVDPQEVVDQLKNITSEPVWDNGVLVKSAPDAMAIAIARAISRVQTGGLSIAKGLEAAQPALFNKESVAPGIAEPVTAAALPSGKPVTVMGKAAIPMMVAKSGAGTSGWAQCPQCSGPLTFQEGCQMCRECGYNKCG